MLPHTCSSCMSRDVQHALDQQHGADALADLLGPVGCYLQVAGVHWDIAGPGAEERVARLVAHHHLRPTQRQPQCT
jgi:hypothetical protein